MPGLVDADHHDNHHCRTTAGIRSVLVPRTHLAIVSAAAGQALLGGTKRVESRFGRRRRPPCGCVAKGDLIHFKISGGTLLGSSQVLATKEFTGMAPRDMDRVRRVYGRLVQAAAEYWTARRYCRHGVLIWLRPLTPPPRRLTIPRQFGNAWLVLGER